MKTIRVFKGMLIACCAALAVGASAQVPDIKVPPKDPPKVPKVLPKIVEQPKVPKDVPKVVVPPKVVTPKNVPKIVNVPKTVNVPKVPIIKEPPKVPKVPNVPKTPVVVKVPTIKEPPKVPKVPNIVKVPDGPKVPKTPVIPKTPVVVAKIPDAPKGPKTPPKVPVINIPNGPKDSPKPPKVPVIAAISKPDVSKVTTKSPKIPGVTPPKAKEPAAPSGTASATLIANQNVAGKGKKVSAESTQEALVRQAVAVILEQDKKRDPGGPKPDTPTIGRSIDFKTPGSGKTSGTGDADDSSSALADAIKVGSGKGGSGSKSALDPLTTPGDALRSVAAGSFTDAKTNKPGANLGFQDKSKVDLSGLAGGSGNSVNGLTSSGIGGPLGDAASGNGTAPNGIASQGTGAVSEVPAPGGFTNVFGKKSSLSGDGFNALFGLDTKKGDVPFSKDDEVSIFSDKKGNVVVGSRNKATGITTYVYNDETIITDKNGKIISRAPTEPGGVKKVTESIKGKTAPTTPPPAPTPAPTSEEPPLAPLADEDPPKTKRPAPEGPDPEALAQFLREHPAIAAQIIASRSGGNGHTDPGTGEGFVVGGVGGSGFVPSAGGQATNLVGQPVTGVNTGGAIRSGPNYNGNDGAIDLGPDSVQTTAGGRQQSEGDFLNKKPSGQGPLNPPNTSSSNASTDDDKDKDKDKGKPKVSADKLTPLTKKKASNKK